MIYQVEESQQSCPKCAKKYNYSSSSSVSSEEEYQKVVIPLKKHVIKHNKNIEHTLNILQEEVTRLKVENEAKDREIGKLRSEMKDCLSKNGMAWGKMPKMYDSPKYATKAEGFISREKPKELHTQRRSLEAKYRNAQQMYYTSPPKQPANSNQELTEQLEKKLHELKHTKFSSAEKLSQQITFYQEEYLKIREKLNVCLEQIEWMEKFCLSFVGMGEKIAHMQGEHLTQYNWPLRKKAKITWKYVKAFVNEVLS